MLTGHIATGLIARTTSRELSTGTWILAAVLADLLVFVFVLIGLERIEFGEGRGAANYFHAVDISLSHSLAGGLVAASVFAGVVLAIGRRRGAAVLAAAVVLGHWVLDAVSHRPDMPLAPGLAWRAGLGLWTSVPATLIVEGGLWVLALVLFARPFGGRRRGPLVLFVLGALLLTVVWVGNIAGPPPANPATAPILSLVLFGLIAAWGYGIEPLRTDR